ncbi:MAG: hypothetical protein R3E18_10400 [Sphingomonadaceae bacterium]
MTTGSGEQAADDAAAGWEAIRADESIQYTPIEIPKMQQEPPDWLKSISEFLQSLFEPLGKMLGMSWPVLKWVLISLAIAALLYVLWRLLAPVLDLGPRKGRAAYEAAAWAPEREEALALLDDADRLAAEGRYDEATHLLLKRSVHQIATAQPDWVEPSSTARELSALPALPDPARQAFRVIAERVERSLFALRNLSADDWQAARAAYADFALQDLPAGTGGSR